MRVDVLLIQPPIRDFYLTAKRTAPYGLACIAEAVAAEGFAVHIHDALASRKSRVLPLPNGFDYLVPYYGRPDAAPFGLFHHYRHYGHQFAHIARAAAASGAWLIGISALFTAYAGEALETAAAVRAACPDAFIVVGGHHPTQLPAHVLAHPAPDAVIRGEGEAAMPLLAKRLRDGGTLSGVPGLVRRSMETPPSPVLVADPRRFPAPTLDRYHDRRYQRRGQIGLTLVASRGCPMACSYCSTGRHTFLTYRRRPAGAVLAEIRAAAAQGPVGFIDFEDEHLALDRDWLGRLLKGIREHFDPARPELRAMNGLFPPSLDAALIHDMADSGFRTLNLSLGTASADQARRFRRPMMTRAFDAALDAAEACGMDAVGYIIVGAPGQTAATSVDDLLYLSRRRVLAGVSVYYPAPGSPDFDRCRAAGLLPADPAAFRSTALPVEDTTTRLEAVTLLRLGRLVNYMKRLVDGGACLDALPRGASTAADARGAGPSLLRRFLAGEGIFGMTPDGTVYPHRVASPVIHQFLKGFDPAQLRGTRK